MKYKVQRYFRNIDRESLGMGYEFYNNILEDLIWKMRDRIGHPFIGEEYRHLRFIMNTPFYHKFCIVCQTTGHDLSMWRGIRIIVDSSLDTGGTDTVLEGIVTLVYEEPDVRPMVDFWTNQSKIRNPFYGLPHIDHVKFNGPATIVFWKDGTKTVVKHDGKGRKDKKQAILYAFIRKIYGEGRPYHNILNEIEEAIKNEKKK